MSKHNRRKRSSSPLGEAGVGLFFSEVLPFIENLEKDDHLLLVIPELPPHSGGGQGRGSSIGIVLDDYLSNLCNADYVQRMAEYTRQCGSLESYFDFRARNPKWAAAHNPDQLLLNICLSARLVISYRYGLALGHAEYASGLTGTEDPSLESPEEHRVPEFPSIDSLPLFITMMGYSEDMQPLPFSGGVGGAVPHSIGYELNGEITMEAYKGSKKS